jgi:hypothetical protein
MAGKTEMKCGIYSQRYALILFPVALSQQYTEWMNWERFRHLEIQF